MYKGKKRINDYTIERRERTKATETERDKNQWWRHRKAMQIPMGLCKQFVGGDRGIMGYRGITGLGKISHTGRHLSLDSGCEQGHVDPGHPTMASHFVVC